MRKRIIFSLVFMGMFSLHNNAQPDKTGVLILGTAHLQQMKGFEPSMLNKVIAKLDSFDFDVICIEKMSGELLNDIKSRQDPSFDEITKGGWGATFLALADTVQQMNKMTSPEAEQNILTLLKQDKLSTEERKQLLFCYLAGTDLPSAALQYLYINDTSVFSGEFEKYIVQIVEKNIARHNEYYSLAARLAKQENINRLEPIDNFQDEALLFKYYPDFMEDYTTHSDQLNEIGQLPVYQQLNQITREGVQANDLSGLYEFLNSDGYMASDYEGQWDIWLKTNFPSGSDRARYSLWEMRNLQITANIMNVAARYPGKKILVIIGASHKGFLEKHLKQVKDIEVLKYE